MKKKITFLSLMLSIALLFSVCTVYAGIDSGEKFNNVYSVKNMLTIDNSGNAEINVSYYAKSGLTCLLAETELKKRGFLGLVWTTVDIGTDNNKWVDISNNITDSFTHYISLSTRGTYKIVTEFTVAGIGGDPDVEIIEYQAEY